MPSDPASSATPVAPGPDHGRDEVDRLLLPPLRERLRESLGFLAIAQTIYAVTLPFSRGLAFEQRASINLARLLVLYVCVYALRGEGSRRHSLTVTGIGLGTQLVTGVLISIVRQDVLPMVLLVTVLTCISSVLNPWGGWAQLVLATGGALSILVASWAVYLKTGQRLGFDPAVTVLVSLMITTAIAFFLERSRRTLEERLDEARRTDAELAALRAQLERRVADRTAELEMANRELEGFSYTVSHDLRSPLRTIAGFSQVLLDESRDHLNEGERANLRKIHAASRRMDVLIDDMLLLARVGRSALRYEMVDLATIARSVAAELASEQPDRRVEVEVGTIPVVQGDHALLRIAMENLLRNAWKFTATRSDANIHVSGERVGLNVVCRVRDNGIGFDPRFRNKLFQPFERIHDHPEITGTGVGLATVARVARRHGGDVDADGAPDGGATFTITLPAVRPA